MKVLIVYAHPEPASFNGAMKDQIIETMTREGHDVTLSDLYAMNWQAATGPDDFTFRANREVLRLQTEQAHAWRTRSFAPDLAMEIDRLDAAELVIFQFPLWWWSLPAILKGYVDRVFAYGFAYGQGASLAGKKALCCLTTGGPAASFESDKRGTILTLLRPVHQGVFDFCNMQALPPFVAYGAARLDDPQRREVLINLDHYLSQIQEVPALTFD
ncbi:MAG: NAD(P)H-dependent oxidoreductase [Saprospiraceae bacterium]|nr:NAD(P)H-dependent oxidoreductase [Saprospiraceae bacterium]